MAEAQSTKDSLYPQSDNYYQAGWFSITLLRNFSHLPIYPLNHIHFPLTVFIHNTFLEHFSPRVANTHLTGFDQGNVFTNCQLKIGANAARHVRNFYHI